MRWTFQGLHNDIPNAPPFEVMVEADDEEEARHLAMMARWGARAPNIAPNIFNGRYEGRGLVLIERR